MELQANFLSSLELKKKCYMPNLVTVKFVLKSLHFLILRLLLDLGEGPSAVYCW